MQEDSETTEIKCSIKMMMSCWFRSKTMTLIVIVTTIESIIAVVIILLSGDILSRLDYTMTFPLSFL